MSDSQRSENRLAAKRRAELAEPAHAEQELNETTEGVPGVTASDAGLWTWNIRTNETYLSPQWKKQLGYEDHEIANSYAAWESRLHPGDRDRVVSHLKTCLQKDWSLYEAEFRLRHKDGSYRLIRAHASVMKDPDGPVRLVGSHVDLTERRKVDARLRKLSTVFMDAADPILITDLEGRVTDMNTEAVRAYGWTPEELIGQSVKTALPPRLHDEAEKRLRQCRDGEPVRNVESRRQHRSGRVWPVLVTVSVVTDDQGEPAGMAILTKDLTALKEAERVIRRDREWVQTLAAELTRTEERERHRLADDLHEELAQQLVSCAVKLNLVDTSTLSPDCAKHVREVSTELEDAQRYTRSLMSQLSPTVVYDLGLVPALESMVDDLYEQHALGVGIESDSKVVGLDDDLAIFLFRAIRELLVNVIKHAGVKEATVSLTQAKRELTVVVADKGVGFKSEEWPHTSRLEHFGLFSIRERLEARGGAFHISSAAGQGTRVELVVPTKAQ